MSETHAGLTDEMKVEIQEAYRRWLGNRGFKPRRGQRQMIADIARGLTDGDRLCVVEAGTGTGKTAAYCLAAIPIAKAQDKRVVISTATVALQEQVALRDLPDLQRHAGLDFTFALAKGRNRYLCPKRLDDRLAYDPDRDGALFAPPEAEHLAVYRRMDTLFARGSWDGDLDSWDDSVPPGAWSPVTNDRAGCLGRRCAYYHQCPALRARSDTAEADVVVANHDLVLTDLRIGGGVVLPDPAETLFVLDEAHHLPDKTRDRFTSHVAVRGCSEWIREIVSSVDTMARRFDQPREVQRARERLADEAGDAPDLIANVDTIIRDLPFQGDEQTETYRFPLGEIPDELAEMAAPLGRSFGNVAGILGDLGEDIEEVMEGNLDWSHADQVEAWLPTIGQLASRAAGAEALFSDYGAHGEAMAARWASRRPADARSDVELTSAPLAPGEILKENLWETCHGALATSATLCALGRFDRFLESAGLGDEVGQSRIASPFDFPRIATFSVPRMGADPSDARAHTEEVASRLPGLLDREPSALVLFTSWRQFDLVIESLPEEVRERCHVQGERSKQRLVRDHRAAVDRGESSYLFGLASFAEGLDLPGDYCRHVIITKIPFAVPDDPVDQSVSEWLEKHGRNPFMELSLPDASLRLVQACGRLIRHETDGGWITLLDRRIVTRRYGESLLAALPPYRLDT